MTAVKAKPLTRKKAVRKEYAPAIFAEGEWDALIEALRKSLPGRKSESFVFDKMVQVATTLRARNNEPAGVLDLKLDEFPGQVFISEHLARMGSPFRLVQIGTLPPSSRERKVAFARISK